MLLKLVVKGENCIIYFVKSQNFDEIVFFSAGSENSSVHKVHEFSGSVEKAKYRKIMTFTHGTCIHPCAYQPL